MGKHPLVMGGHGKNLHKGTVLVSCPRQKESPDPHNTPHMWKGLGARNWELIPGERKNGIKANEDNLWSWFNGKQLVKRVCVDPRKHWEVKVEKVRRPTDLQLRGRTWSRRRGTILRQVSSFLASWTAQAGRPMRKKLAGGWLQVGLETFKTQAQR